MTEIITILSEAIKKSAKNMEVGKMKLRKITLADLEKIDLEEQMLKIQEEGNEVGFAYNNYKWDAHEKSDRLNKSRLHLISELYDLIQATAGAIWILENGVSMNNEHIEKMEKYIESGRINNKAREEWR